MFKILKFLSVSIIIAIFLFGTFFLLFNFNKQKSVFAGENLGGWSWSGYYEAEYGKSFGWGWSSDNCNNQYFGNYEDYCGIDTPPVLDVNFDGNDIDFDSGEVLDNSGNGFNGTLVDMDISDIRNRTGDSSFDNCLNFNENNGHVNFGGISPHNWSNITVSVWIYWTGQVDSNGYAGVYYKDDSKDIGRLWITSDGKVSIKNSTFEFISDDPSDVPINEWINIAYAYVHNEDIGREYIYVNGEVKGERERHGNIAGSSENFLVGSGNTSDDCLFYGKIDNVRVFGEALSDDQILHNMYHNSNYSLNVEDNTGDISGWAWSNGIGWIRFGGSHSVYGDPPYLGINEETKLHWSPAQGQGLYPHMITGWANAISFKDPQDQDKNIGWLSLQSPDLISANYDEYSDCVSCSNRDEESGLVGYWKFDESFGENASDSSGFNNRGTLYGFDFFSSDHSSFWIDDGKVNNCLYFDGEDDYVEVNVISANPELDMKFNDFSVEVWINTTDELAMSPFIVESTFWGLYFDYGEDKIEFSFKYEDEEYFVKSLTDLDINDGLWHHLVVVVNRNNNLELYIDKVKDIFVNDDISSLAGVAMENTESILIGGDGENRNWKGDLDIVRIYNFALSQDEIEYNYEHPEKRVCSACLEQTKDEEESKNVCYECQRCLLENNETNCEQCSSCRKYGLVFDSNTANIKGFTWGGYETGEGLFGLGWVEFSPKFGAGFYRSYVSAKYGNIYSGSDIGSDYSIIPPVGYFNATYMIQASGRIVNWVSEQISEVTAEGWFYNYSIDEPWMTYFDSPRGFLGPSYRYPKLETNYGNILGSLDYQGLINGLYGEVEEGLPEVTYNNPNVCLEGKVYLVTGDTILEKTYKTDSYKFENCSNGSGTIIIEGDLTIEGNVKYDSSAVSGGNVELASAAWIIKGDLKIDPSVTRLAGTFIVLGGEVDGNSIECGSDLESPVQHCGAIYTCYTEEDCNQQLKVSGQFLVKNFQLQRTFRGIGELREAAEVIIYDGRNVINPPPGLGDILKSLPRWDQIAPY